MADQQKYRPTIRNRKAKFDYQILETFTAGIVLLGTEVKSLRLGKASLQEAYCYVADGEAFIKGMNIKEYTQGGYTNHDPLRERKLLLKKREIEKIRKALDQKGLTLVPLKLFFNDRNMVKMEIGLARGKQSHDKRESIKARDTQREIDRQLR